MKSNTTGNYIIAIKGTSEEIQLEKVNERLRTQTIELIGQRVDLRSGIFQAMVTDKTFAELVCHAAEYYNSVHKNTPNQVKSIKKLTNDKSKKDPNPRKAKKNG